MQLLLEATNIKKYYVDRLIINIHDLKIYDRDRIGIVGLNGSGKTTLINVLMNRIPFEEGFLKIHSEFSYISQLDEEISQHLSGGEKTNLKIQKAFSKNCSILFADEPTSNLDIKNINRLETMLKQFNGAVVLISHDRALLDNICTKIIEIENGTINTYSGNFTNYKKQKQLKRTQQEFEYEEYIKQKNKLEGAREKIYHEADAMKKAPSRMGNSEARLHKGAFRQSKGNLTGKVNIIESKLEHLQVKNRPSAIVNTKIDIASSSPLHSKVIISAKDISKSFYDKILFEDVTFNILNGSKTALIGDNGTGKTTLLKLLLQQQKGIAISKASKIGYFSQSLDILDYDKTLYENIIEDSVVDKTLVRTLLSRLLFKREDLNKKVSLLSGGERVKASFAKIFTKDINMLILDEPTNYLDIESVEALISVLKDYLGTVLFISHDRSFISALADQLLVLENKKIHCFQGNYEQYSQMLKPKASSEDTALQLMLLENKLAELLSRHSSPTKKDDIVKLDSEYKEILTKIKHIKA